MRSKRKELLVVKENGKINKDYVRIFLEILEKARYFKFLGVCGSQMMFALYNEDKEKIAEVHIYEWSKLLSGTLVNVLEVPWFVACRYAENKYWEVTKHVVYYFADFITWDFCDRVDVYIYDAG